MLLVGGVENRDEPVAGCRLHRPFVVGGVDPLEVPTAAPFDKEGVPDRPVLVPKGKVLLVVEDRDEHVAGCRVGPFVVGGVDLLEAPTAAPSHKEGVPNIACTV